MDGGSLTGRGLTSLSSVRLAMARALESRGCNAASPFVRAGLDPSALENREARYPVEATTALWRLSVEATGDPCFGLEVVRHVRPSTFHALGFSLAASGSVTEAFGRIVRYHRLVSEEAVIRYDDLGDAYRLSAQPVGPCSTRRSRLAARARASRS